MKSNNDNDKRGIGQWYEQWTMISIGRNIILIRSSRAIYKYMIVSYDRIWIDFILSEYFHLNADSNSVFNDDRNKFYCFDILFIGSGLTTRVDDLSEQLPLAAKLSVWSQSLFSHNFIVSQAIAWRKKGDLKIVNIYLLQCSTKCLPEQLNRKNREVFLLNTTIIRMWNTKNAKSITNINAEFFF